MYTPISDISGLSFKSEGVILALLEHDIEEWWQFYRKPRTDKAWLRDVIRQRISVLREVRKVWGVR